ncbi:MAG: YcxB family protein [Ruminococcaceae bacterium]|nr:YcxB family protein [Oscillospiraceae bacterium]
MENNPVSVSFLTTNFDYADFKSAAARADMQKGERLVLRITGAVLVLSALLLQVYSFKSVTNSILYAVMAAAGILVGFFYELIAQYTLRRRALHYFDANKEKFIAQTTEFHEEEITFQTERYTAAIPYDLFYRAYEDGRVFILYTGINEMRFIPKRAMGDSESAQIRNILQTKLQEKYQQEGAR